MLQKVNLLITGPPRCGKSTLINRLITFLRSKSLKVGGITTPDFKLPSGRRGGFLIQDIATGAEQTMAALGLPSRLHVGRYGVDAEAILTIGITALQHAVISADVVIIDEIGKMELLVPQFQPAVLAALDSKKPLVGSIGLKLRLPFATRIKQRQDVTVFNLSHTSQDETYHHIIRLLGLSKM